MSRRARLVLLLAGLGVLGAVLVWGMTGLPDFGHAAGAYGRRLAETAVPDRTATNTVMVITFDYRGLDTLGEEFILFAAAIGVTLLLRTQRTDRERAAMDELAEEPPRTSESLRWIGGGLTGPVFVLAAYIVVHGHLTPGGGFQGGVMLMAAVVLILLVGGYGILHRLRGEPALEAVEAIGAAGFAAIGIGGLLAGGALLENFIDTGTKGLLTGGTIPLMNVAVGVEVAGALLVIATEFADPRFLLRGRRR